MSSTDDGGVKFVIEQRDEIEVYVGEHGHVCIKQGSRFDDDSVIVVHPGDIPQLIDFLARAKMAAESAAPPVREA